MSFRQESAQLRQLCAILLFCFLSFVVIACDQNRERSEAETSDIRELEAADQEEMKALDDKAKIAKLREFSEKYGALPDWDASLRKKDEFGELLLLEVQDVVENASCGTIAFLGCVCDVYRKDGTYYVDVLYMPTSEETITLSVQFILSCSEQIARSLVEKANEKEGLDAGLFGVAAAATTVTRKGRVNVDVHVSVSDVSDESGGDYSSEVETYNSILIEGRCIAMEYIGYW